MSLEFEKLTEAIAEMATTTAQRVQRRKTVIETAVATIQRYRTNWTAISQALVKGEALADQKYYRVARPLDESEPLDATIDAPSPPATATLVATDGSQIMPDRHAAYLYYLLNVGGLIYYHGDAERPPVPFTQPDLIYPEDDLAAAQFAFSNSSVSIERDLQEISVLAHTTWELRDETKPLLALLDQRLLYWPIGGTEAAANKAVATWSQKMTEIRQHGALLAGYIDQPGKNGVVTLLKMVTAVHEDAPLVWKQVGTRLATDGLTDANLFAELLQPGQRSKIFVDVSPSNERFAENDPLNEVCFFYIHPGGFGQKIARVDLPLWVAEDAAAVTAVHALIIDQCHILSGYPYALARADEMAVVGARDQENLEAMMDLYMQSAGVSAEVTAKQQSKELARGGKTRHMGLGGR